MSPDNGTSVRIAPGNRAGVKSRPKSHALGAHREAPFARCAGMSAEGGCPPSNLHTASILKMWISAGCQGASEVLLAIRPADAYHSDRIARLLPVIRRAATASAVR